MQSLDEKTWGVFQLEDEFDCTKGVYLPTGDVIDGDDPFVTAKAGNNGLSRMIGNGTLFDGNRITIEKIKLNAYYQPAPFYCSHDVSVISNAHLNKDNSQFIAEMIMRNGSKYSYGRQAQLNVVKRERIMLPVTDFGEPDYEYMAEYTQQKREAMLSKYRAYVEERIAELGDPVEIPALDEKEWAHFKIPEVFDMIQRGKRLKNADHVPGNVPYVSSTANNNGVDDYIEATPGTRVFGDCISLANSGSVGAAFYEPFEFVASDHVTALKADGLTKYEYLFMTSMIEKQGSNFNFNREINDARIRNMQIMLPVADSGEPDYEYMEQYAKNMMLRKYRQYLAFLDQSGDTQ